MRVRPFFVPVLLFALACSGFAQVLTTTAQEKADDLHGRVQVNLEVLNLHYGLPGGPASGSLISVGGHLGKQTSMRKDSSGKTVYVEMRSQSEMPLAPFCRGLTSAREP